VTQLRSNPAEVQTSGEATPAFTDRDVSLVCQALPDKVVPARRELMPAVLREWSRNDLREHVSTPLRAPPERRKRMERIRECAQKLGQELVQALNEVDDLDRCGLADMMVQAAGQTGIAGRAEFIVLNQRIDEAVGLLNKLAEAADRTWKYDRGGPRNILAYLVIMDIAAMWEWLTMRPATRHTPFRRFAAAIWPVVIGKADDGLHSAMKNWAKFRKKYNERSPLMANINMRHPEWGVFAPDPMKSPR
jgi:hypothetical protein